MFNRKQNEIDRLNVRCVELAQMLKETNDKTKYLEGIRRIIAKNNIKLIEKNNKLQEHLKEINKIIAMNKYSKPELAFKKLKELISDFDSEN